MSEPKLGPTPAQITMMGHNIHAQIVATRRRRRRMRTLVVGAGAAAIVGATVTAAALAVQPAAPHDIRYTVDCYTVADPGADYARNLYDTDANSDVPFGEEFALLICDNAYRRAQAVVPNPTVCELADLRLGVFPNPQAVPAEDYCLGLGLHAPES